MQYSTVPPWLRLLPSLIDALTGAPGRAFLPCGSEVVSLTAGLQMPCTIWHPLWVSACQRMSSSLLLSKKKYHKFFRKSMVFQESGTCQKRKSSVEITFRLVHNAETTKTGKKNHKMMNYVNICNFSTPYIVFLRRKHNRILWRVYIII